MEDLLTGALTGARNADTHTSLLKLGALPTTVVFWAHTAAFRGLPSNASRVGWFLNTRSLTSFRIARFEYRPTHRLSRLRFSAGFLSPSNQSPQYYVDMTAIVFYYTLASDLPPALCKAVYRQHRKITTWKTFNRKYGLVTGEIRQSCFRSSHLVFPQTSHHRGSDGQRFEYGVFHTG
jgi:hypothetical protein